MTRFEHLEEAQAILDEAIGVYHLMAERRVPIRDIDIAYVNSLVGIARAHAELFREMSA